MPELRELIDVYVRRNGQFIPVYYFDDGGDPVDDSLIDALANKVWQSLYVEETDEYNDTSGVWNDNGTSNKNTVLVAGSAPSIQTAWRNDRRAVSFDGSNSLRIAQAADNYNTLNTRQSIFLVGEYNEAEGLVAKFVEAGLFELLKAESDLAPMYRNITTDNPFLVRSSFRNMPFVLGVFAYQTPNRDQVYVYLNGDFIARFAFTSRAFTDVFMGNANLNGQIASLGLTQNEEVSGSFKEIIRKVNQYYDFTYALDNQLVFMGDSLTTGTTIPNKEDFWTFNLISDLESTHSEIFRYFDTSTPGIRVPIYDANEFDDNLAFINGQVINRRILYIWLGSNDFAPFDVPTVDAATMLANIVEFITNRLKAGFKKIAVGTVIDRIEFQNTPSIGTEVDTYNADLKAYDFSSLETSYGASIVVVPLDEQTELQDATNTTYFDVDQVHLNATGAAVVKTQMQSAYETLRAVTVPVDTVAPTMDTLTLDNSNSFLDIMFSKGLYGDSQSYSLIDINNFEITDFIAGGATAASITSIEPLDTSVLVGNEKRVRLNLSYTGTPDGTESFTVSPNNLFDILGNQMTAKSSVVNLNSLHPDLQAVIDAAVLAGETIPSSTDLDNIDILIKDLDALGAWSLIDRMLCYASDGDEAFNLRQYKNPSVSAINNGATFNQGQDFDGVTGYINLNMDLSTLTNYSLLDASIIIYYRTNNVNQFDLGVLQSGNFVRLFPNRTTTSFVNINDTSASGFPAVRLSNVGTNHFNIRDLNGTNSQLEIFSDGTLYEGVQITPSAIPSLTPHEFGLNNNGSNESASANNHSIVIIGGDLSSYAAGIHTAIDKFATSQGINV